MLMDDEMHGTCEYANEGAKLDFIAVEDSTADFFSYAQACQHQFTEFQAPEGDAHLAPYTRPFRSSNAIGPTDVNATMPPSKALTHRLQVIDRWTPNTDWGGGMLAYNPKNGGYFGNRQGTYPNIDPTLRPPLELPRYSYAAMDTEAIYAEAQDRVKAFMETLYGKVSGGG